MTLKTITDLILEHGFFNELPRQTVEMIAGCGRNIIIEGGHSIFREGGHADYFYLIRQGRAALKTHMPGRGIVAFQSLTAGDILGVSWLVQPYQWDFDAWATETIHAIALDANCLRTKCEEDHTLGYRLMMKFVPALVDRLRSARIQALDVYGT